MEQVAPILQKLADQFGIGVQYLWPYLVAYTRAQSMGTLAVSLSIFAMSALLIPFCARKFSRNVYLYNNRDDEAYADYNFHALAAVGAAVTLAATCFFLVSALMTFPTALAGVIAPEGKAIIDIVGKVNSR
jgi:hypothetical protein